MGGNACMRIVGTKGLRLHVEFEESEDRAWQEANILGGVSFTKGVYTIDVMDFLKGKVNMQGVNGI